MARDTAVEYTLEQAVALLAGKISVQALNNRSQSVQKYCRDMFNSKGFWSSSAVNRYYQQLVSDIWQGELRTANDQALIKIPTGDGQYRIESMPQDQLTDEYELSTQTRFSRAELRRWAASHQEAHSFLMNQQELSVARGESWAAGKQAFLEAEGFAQTAANVLPGNESTQSQPQDSALEPELASQIAALLEGRHPCQADELRVALQAWLAISGQHSRGELKSDPATALKAWITEHLDNPNGYQISRVAGMANWNSPHPKLRLVQ